MDQTQERRGRKASSTSKSREGNQADTIWWSELQSMRILNWIPFLVFIARSKENQASEQGGLRSKQHLAQCDALIAKTIILKPSALQQNMSPAIQYVNQSRLCPRFVAEHETKQVILNQPPHQPVTDASSRMPNKKPNGMPGLHSLHPSLPQEEGQMVPVTQKNAKRLSSHSNNLCPSPVTVCHPYKRYFSRAKVRTWCLVGKHNRVLSGTTSRFATWAKIIPFCTVSPVCSYVWEGKALGNNAWQHKLQLSVLLLAKLKLSKPFQEGKASGKA